MRPDHRERVAERDDDLGLDARQLGRQHEMLGNRNRAGAARVVEPVHPEQVQRVGFVGPDPGKCPLDLEAGRASGSASWAIVGRTTRAARNRSTVRSSTPESIGLSVTVRASICTLSSPVSVADANLGAGRGHAFRASTERR